jgi:hypothetical protein
MTPVRSRLLLTAALLGVFAVPGHAGPLTASSAAGGSSASSAASSASESAEGSSASSKRAVAALDGPYRVVDVTPVPERPGTVRMTLRPLAAGGSPEDVSLYLPSQALERGGLAQGTTVTANRRPYGVELAHADTRKAFFLVLDDDWKRELRSNPVAL